MSIAYLDGHFLPLEEAKIPITDRGFLFGDGVFTTLRVNEGKPECLERHWERLQSQCNALHIIPPHFSASTVTQLIHQNRAQKGIWRLKMVATGGSGNELHLPKRSGSFLMRLTPYQPPVEPSKLCIYPFPIHQPLSKIKTLAYIDRLYLKEYAMQRGCDDALVTSLEEHLFETAFSNIFWKEGTHLYTPKREKSLFEGLSLQFVLQAARKLGLEIREVLVKKEEIPSQAQFYQCNCLMGIHPIHNLDERIFTRDITFEEALKAKYAAIVKNLS